MLFQCVGLHRVHAGHAVREPPDNRWAFFVRDGLKVWFDNNNVRL